jgi:hypothetical protein
MSDSTIWCVPGHPARMGRVVATYDEITTQFSTYFPPTEIRTALERSRFQILESWDSEEKLTATSHGSTQGCAVQSTRRGAQPPISPAIIVQPGQVAPPHSLWYTCPQ